MTEVEQLKAALRDCLGFIEMKCAHTGSMSVPQIEKELERVRGLSSIETAHHWGCSVTTRRVDLDLCRRLTKEAA